MKTVKGLFDRLCSPEHLAAALKLTARGKRRRAEVAWFLFNAEAELGRIGRELRSGGWEPLGFDHVRLYDPKPRLIGRAPFVDRVVHAALATLLEEAWAPRLMPEDVACRAGMGVHRARLRLLQLRRAHRFVVHLDLRAYFPSVDLDILRHVLGRRIADPRYLDMLDRVLVAGAGMIDWGGLRAFLRLGEDWPPRGNGLPLGAYTSQVLATHVFLNDFDHFVKRTLKVPGYLRYVDDLFLFADRASDLERWRGPIGAWLADERHLRLKHPDAPVLGRTSALSGLGAVITREGIAPDARAWKRIRERIRAALHGKVAEAQVRAWIRSLQV